jgi:flagellar protein FliL
MLPPLFESDRKDWLIFARMKWRSTCTMLSIMATSSPLSEVAASSSTANSAVPGSVKRSLASLLVAAVAGAVIASAVFGGALYYLARSGRLSLRKSVASKSLAAIDIPTHLLALDPLLVNLADADGTTYAKLSITLQVEDAATTKDSKSSANKSGDSEVAAVRDTALTVLGQQTANNLLLPHGKEDLKAELMKEFKQNNPGLKIKKILFTDFLVQR